MKGSFTRRAALLAAVGAAVIGGSTAAWLGIDTASGLPPSASGGSLNAPRSSAFVNCPATPEQIAGEAVVVTP